MAAAVACAVLARTNLQIYALPCKRIQQSTVREKQTTVRNSALPFLPLHLSCPSFRIQAHACMLNRLPSRP
jgi:hypothetical protein